MSVKFNGVLVPQPTVLTERLVQVQSENYSINGSLQRNRIGQKKEAALEYTYLTPSGYQQLIGYVTTGSGFSYSNDASNYTGGLFTFSGLPFFEESDYVRGGSLYRKLKVRIREQ